MPEITIETLAKQVETLAKANEALAKEVETLKTAPPSATLPQEVEARILKLEQRPAVAQESVTVKKKEAKGIPSATFKHDKAEVRLTVGAIRHEGAKLTAQEILDMPAADRKAIIEKYPNIVESV